MFGLHFEPTLDVGHFLTFVTLVVGFVGAGYNAAKSWRRRTEDEAKSGALRLLLRILRQFDRPVCLDDLMAEFESPSRRDERRAYCGTDWHFKTRQAFEAAVYRLDWEGKIDFVNPDEIVFRVDSKPELAGRFVPDSRDAEQLQAVLRRALESPEGSTWDLRDLTESSMRVAPEATCDLLRELLHSGEPSVPARVATAMSRFVEKPLQPRGETA